MLWLKVAVPWLIAVVYAHANLHIRDDTTAISTHTTGGAAQKTTTSLASSTDGSSTSMDSTSTEIPATSLSTITSAADTSVIPPTSTPVASSSSNVTASSDPDALPLQPKITPAIGVAGILLILSGLALGLVGIRQKQIQIFLSTTLAFALAIEVLIIYVMNAPVKDSLQGGYLVAGVVGGAFFGLLALVFPDIAEGFGAGLGGLCFAMWILVLHTGGTVQSDWGRAVLLAGFAGICWSFSFSRITREYAIIVCTAFAGATTFVLGIDCYSKAGLKEFWLYIWNLNPDIFPLGTTTYPVTRYIKVEIAVIIICWALCMISQLKLWEKVKQRRSIREPPTPDEEQKEYEMERKHEATQRDLEAWERKRAGKNEHEVTVDEASPVPTVRRASGSLHEGDLHGSVTSGETYGERHRDYDNASYLAPAELFPQQSTHSSQENLLPSALTRRASAGPILQRSHAHNTEIQAFYVKPGAGSKRDVYRDAMNPRDATHDNAVSQSQRAVADALPPEPASVPPELEPEPETVEDDRASSVAATAAEGPDIDALSVGLTSRHSRMFLAPSARNSMILLPEEPIEEDEEALQLPVPSPTIDQHSGASDSGKLSQDADPQPQVASLGEHLAHLKVPKVLAKGRIDAWAREAADAEPAPRDELPDFTPGATQVVTLNAAEVARAEENNAKPQPEPKAQPEENREASTQPVLTVNDQRHSLPPPAPTPIYAHSPQDNGNRQILERQNSVPLLQNRSPLSARTNRHVSAPLGNAILVASPTENVDIRTVSQPNLLDQRDHRLNTRLSTVSFAGIGRNSLPNMLPTPTSEHNMKQRSNESLPNLQEEAEEDDDDIPLKRRQSRLKRNSVSSSQDNQPLALLATAPSRRNTLADADPVVRPSIARHQSTALEFGRMASYDSHQPRRTATHDPNRASQNWAQWHNARATVAAARPDFEADARLQALRQQQEQLEAEKQARHAAKEAQRQAMERRMRQGALRGEHTAVMRQLQAQAQAKSGEDEALRRAVKGPYGA